MAALFLAACRDPDAPDPPALAAADAQFARHGFAAATSLTMPGWRGRHAPYIANPLATRHVDGDDWVAIAGTLVHDGLMGDPALAALLRSFVAPAPDWSRLGGQFVALVHKHGRSFLFTDYLGAFPLYHDADRRTFSTSLLALLAGRTRVGFSAQGVWEYAFNIAPVGDDTVIAGVRTLGPNEVVELTLDGIRRHAVAKPLPDAPAALPLAERVERARTPLAAIIGAHAAAFGNAIHCPLSGGIDARLLLASLRAYGSAPSVYVYGDADSADVAIARAIGDAEDFPVAWIDKRRGGIDPDAFPALVEAEFHALDALPNYGNIFDQGGNAAALDARHAGGGLAASGGGGEVYRDFFYLPDRPTSVDDLTRSFFARFAAGDAAPDFDPRGFLAAIAVKVAAALDAPVDRTLPRGLIEQAYPRVRCRALFGREIGIEARYGPYLMPFLDHHVVAEALTLPMSLKQAGRFEAALLTAIDPALARHPSTYGHAFDRPPGVRRRLREWSTRARPAWLRANSYAWRRRLGPLADDHGGLLGPDYLPHVIDPAFPAMRRYFAVDRVTDSGLLRRIAALEYLAGQLGSRLIG